MFPRLLYRQRGVQLQSATESTSTSFQRLCCWHCQLWLIDGCVKSPAITISTLLAEVVIVCLCALHSQAVVEAKTNFVPNRVLSASPPDISPLESLLPRSVCTTLAQLRSGHCRLLNSYKARITSGISDVCLSGVCSGTTLHRTSVRLSKPSDATHSARPMGQPGCGHRLPQPGRLMIREALLGYHNNSNVWQCSFCYDNHRRTSQFFSRRGEPSLSKKVFWQRPKNCYANMQNYFAQLTPPSNY